MKSGCKWWRYTMNKCSICCLLTILKRNILFVLILVLSICLFIASGDILFVFLDLHTLGILSTTQQNGLAVPDASMYPVTSTSDVITLMDIGLQNRAVGSTALNERSSRSHRFFFILIPGNKKYVFSSALNVVTLNYMICYAALSLFMFAVKI